jgi:hypothetical protein
MKVSIRDWIVAIVAVIGVVVTVLTYRTTMGDKLLSALAKIITLENEFTKLKDQFSAFHKKISNIESEMKSLDIRVKILEDKKSIEESIVIINARWESGSDEANTNARTLLVRECEGKRKCRLDVDKRLFVDLQAYYGNLRVIFRCDGDENTKEVSVSQESRLDIFCPFSVERSN